MSDLRQYLSKTKTKDVPTLAFLTGIDRSILELVADGQLSLGSVHKTVIKEYLPSIPDSLLSPKHRSLVADERTGRGEIPDGYTFLSISAAELVPGDLLLESHQSGVAGSGWIRVVSIKEQGVNAVLSTSGADIRVNKTNLVKVARKSNDG